MKKIHEILIVEDDEKIAQTLKSGLIKSGFDAAFVKNKKEAEKILKKRVFDMILSDLSHPEMEEIIEHLVRIQKKPPKGKPKILIVEDDKLLSDGIKVKLEAHNFKTEAVFNGKEALNILRKKVYSLVLLDLKMPIVDGFKVLEVLREREFHTPIFVFTNLGGEMDRKRAKELGISNYFLKAETSLSDIVSRINKTIGT